MTLSPLSKVDTILVKMLEAYPSLRHTRLDAIHDIATDYQHEWQEDGSLKVAPGCCTRDYDAVAPEDDKDVVRARDKIGKCNKVKFREAEYAYQLLWKREDVVKEAFIRDNADLIVRAGVSFRFGLERNGVGHGFGTTIPTGTFRLIECMPENADPEWKSAFIELLENILYFDYKESKFEDMAPDYAQRYRDDLDAAKVKARKLLVRLKGSDEDKAKMKNEMARKFAALQAEAASMGFALTGDIA